MCVCVGVWVLIVLLFPVCSHSHPGECIFKLVPCVCGWLTYGRWMDGFGLSDRVLLMVEEKKVKELIITVAESMSGGAAVTFSSLCQATIKKCIRVGGWCVCVCVCTWQSCAHIHMCVQDSEVVT